MDEPAGGVATGDRRRAALKRTPDLDTLYCINADGSRNTIHTADVRGRFQTWKRLLWVVLIAIYVVVPWVRIDGRPLVLIDIANRHFWLFGSTFNAQDFYLAFFLVSGIGFALFVVSALFGRVWCGYACPQTVFLEGVYRRIERWIEGSAPQRRHLDASPWNLNKTLRRGGKWLAFLLVSLALSHTFLGYFMPVEELVLAVVSPPTAHWTAFVFVWVFTAILYFNFAWFREQLCIVLCPYGRLQGALYDRDTINVAYDTTRGEPRGRYTEGDKGDCIDCFRCVAVCPTGIDIRNGTQLECIGCANCIDACDDVMTKVGRPIGLIRYDSQNGIERQPRRFVRPRLFAYAVLLLVGVTVFTFAAVGRTPFESNLVRQQGAPYVLSGDTARNPFVLHIVNKQPETVTFTIEPTLHDGLTAIVATPTLTLETLRDIRVPVFLTVERRAFRRGERVPIVVTGVTASGRTLTRTVHAQVFAPDGW